MRKVQIVKGSDGRWGWCIRSDKGAMLFDPVMLYKTRQGAMRSFQSVRAMFLSQTIPMEVSCD